MFSHLFREGTQPDTGEVVDGESDVAGIVFGEDAFQVWPQHVIRHPCLELGSPNLLHDALKQNLDEDATTGRRLILVQMDHRQTVPTDGVDAKHVAKQLSNVS